MASKTLHHHFLLLGRYGGKALLSLQDRIAAMALRCRTEIGGEAGMSIANRGAVGRDANRLRM